MNGVVYFMNITAAPNENHLKLLRLLEANPGMSQRDLSRELGISLGKTNYCIKHLLDRDFIRMQNCRAEHNKLAYAYRLTPAGFSAKVDLTLRFLQDKIDEYENLKTEIKELQREASAISITSNILLKENI